MFTKRIIPCLDVNQGRVVKGVNFVNLRDAGDPVEIAAAYDKAGADELVFLDITATSDARETVVDMVRKVAEKVFIPFTVGGGIRTVDDFKALLREGADKISINSSAINNPNLISEAADKFGSQCVVVAIDARRREDGSGWNIYKNGGRIDVGMDAVEWAMKADRLGAGEILLTSMDCDGTKAGCTVRIVVLKERDQRRSNGEYHLRRHVHVIKHVRLVGLGLIQITSGNVLVEEVSFCIQRLICLCYMVIILFICGHVDYFVGNTRIFRI